MQAGMAHSTRLVAQLWHSYARHAVHSKAGGCWCATISVSRKPLNYAAKRGMCTQENRSSNPLSSALSILVLMRDLHAVRISTRPLDASSRRSPTLPPPSHDAVEHPPTSRRFDGQPAVFGLWAAVGNKKAASPRAMPPPMS